MRSSSSHALSAASITTPSTPQDVAAQCTLPAPPGNHPAPGRDQALASEARRSPMPISHACPPVVLGMVQAALGPKAQHAEVLQMICELRQPWPASVRHLARRLCDNRHQAQDDDRVRMDPLYSEVARGLDMLDDLDRAALQAGMEFEPSRTLLPPDQDQASACGFMQVVPRQMADHLDPAFLTWGDQEKAEARARYLWLLQKLS